jgi:hypothetical protein
MNSNITITWAQFLADFPEFNTSNVTNPAYPQFSQSTFTYYFNLAVLLLDPQNRFASVINQLTELFIAHHMVLECLAQRDMNTGGVPGVAKGPIAGKSAQDVSISYASGATAEINGSHWNYTIFGQRFLRLAKTLSAGGIQVGPGGACGTAGWPGVIFWDSY